MLCAQASLLAVPWLAGQQDITSIGLSSTQPQPCLADISAPQQDNVWTDNLQAQSLADSCKHILQ